MTKKTYIFIVLIITQSILLGTPPEAPRTKLKKNIFTAIQSMAQKKLQHYQKERQDERAYHEQKNQRLIDIAHLSNQHEQYNQLKQLKIEEITRNINQLKKYYHTNCVGSTLVTMETILTNLNNNHDIDNILQEELTTIRNINQKKQEKIAIENIQNQSKNRSYSYIKKQRPKPKKAKSKAKTKVKSKAKPKRNKKKTPKKAAATRPIIIIDKQTSQASDKTREKLQKKLHEMRRRRAKGYCNSISSETDSEEDDASYSSDSSTDFYEVFPVYDDSDSYYESFSSDISYEENN